MGAVYVVEHIAMRKRMALKVLHREMSGNAEVLARFEREAIAAAHIDHPNVVAASDSGRTDDGTFFMVLEYIEGRSLRSALDQGAFTEARAISLMKQMTSAVARAHELGVVHRDLKPENVMLVARDGGEQVKVLDFGIAKLQGELGVSSAKPGVPLTQLGVVFGTPEYISPEQALGRPVDARADLYALGVILFEMLSGRRPFEADEPVRLLLMHANDPPPPLSTLAPGASPEVGAIVARLLQKDPDARFPDAKALAAALDALVPSETPSATSVSAPMSNPRLLSGQQAAVSGVAPTVAGTMPPATAPSLGVQVATLHSKLPPQLRALRPPVLAAIAAAVLVVPLLVIGIVVATHAGRSPASSASGTAPTPKPPPTERSIDDDDVATASASGSAALERLATKAPKDPRILHALVVAYTHEDKHDAAMGAVRRWATADPTAGKSPDVENAILAAATGTPADLDAAIDVMEGPLGSDGVDLMLDLLAKPGVANATKTRLNKSLAKPEVRAHASPAAALAIDLKATKTCDARYAMLDRVKEIGDAHSLVTLKAMRSTNGCGFLGMNDCWSCMRKDSALDDTIATVEARTR